MFFYVLSSHIMGGVSWWPYSPKSANSLPLDILLALQKTASRLDQILLSCPQPHLLFNWDFEGPSPGTLLPEIVR